MFLGGLPSLESGEKKRRGKHRYKTKPHKINPGMRDLHFGQDMIYICCIVRKLGCTPKGSYGNTALKKGSEKVLGEGSEKGSEKGACYGFFTVRKGSEKGSQKWF